MNDLLGGSLFFIYIFSVVTVINYSKLDNKQKISIIYILTYGIEFNKGSNHANGWILYVAFICAVFLFEEYWNSDKYKNELVKKMLYKILDFLYQFIFVYKGIEFSISYLILMNKDVISNRINAVYNGNFEKIILMSSGIVLVLSIHLMFKWPVEHFSYTEIMNKINVWPYYKMLEIETDIEKFEQRLKLITDIEDRLFFDRDSYTFLSLNYIKVYMCREMKMSTSLNPTFMNCFWVRLKRTKGIRMRIRLVKKGIQWMANNIVCWTNFKIAIIRKIRKGVFLRGHSTIEMQLFRTLSYKRGITVGKPHGIKETYNTWVRKCYEIFFTHIFFSGLKKYLLENGTVNITYYRLYIVYLYIHTVITWYNEKRYMPMSKLFKEKKISEWSMEKLFVAGLGLSQKNRIEMNRVFLYNNIIQKYKLNMDIIEEIITET